jgi:hypothetical protein
VRADAEAPRDAKDDELCTAAFGILQNPPPAAAPIELPLSPSTARNRAPAAAQPAPSRVPIVPDTFLVFSNVMHKATIRAATAA